MFRSKRLAIVRCAVHILPMVAALTLLVLNGMDYYIGSELTGRSGEDDQKLNALVFAAKILELLMLASVGDLLVHYIRKQMVVGGGLPFGAIFSGIQFKDISYLWSPELWGTISAKWEDKKRKWRILSLILVCFVLGVTLGPSTSVLIRPRLEEWPAGGTPFWIDEVKEALYPSVVRDSQVLSHCLLDNNDLACPAGGWQVLADSYLQFFSSLQPAGSVPQEFDVASKHSIRSLVLRSRNADYLLDKILWGNAFTMATVSPAAVADSLAEVGRLWVYASVNGNIGRFGSRKDAVFKTKAEQPLVLVRCNSGGFPNMRSVTLEDANSAVGLYAVAKFKDVEYSTSSISDVKDAAIDATLPAVTWVDDADLLRQTNSSLAAVVTIPPTEQFFRGRVYSCTVDARSMEVELTSTRNRIKHVSSTLPPFDLHGTFNSSYRRIEISSSWARYLTPLIPESDTNGTIFSTLAKIAGVWNSTATGLATIQPYNEIIVENILATLIANGLARTSYNASLVMNLKDPVNPHNLWQDGAWIQELLPRGGRMGSGGNAFVISPDVQSRSAKFQMSAFVNGYAYSARGTPHKLAMIVLAAYSFIILLHMATSIYTGWSSSSWGSGSEVTALAMNSTTSRRLANTGGGIHTVGVFREKVQVRVREGRTQMMFEDTEARGKSERVRENAYYA